MKSVCRTLIVPGALATLLLAGPAAFAQSTGTPASGATAPSAATSGTTKSSETAVKPADTSDSKSTDAKAPGTKFSKSQIEAFLSKCSDEADAKGLDVKKGKGAARKAFRRECMHKLGVEAR